MSKGIGKLQREILVALKDSKCRIEIYNGKGNNWIPDGISEYIYAYGWNVILSDGVYDLRETLKYLARQKGQISHCNYVEASFQSSFSRAVKGLIRRGILEHLNMVPLKQAEGEIDPYGAESVLQLSDGLYLSVPNRNQVRFVSFTGNGGYT